MNSIRRFRAAGNHNIWLAALALLSVWLLYGQVIGLALLHDDALIAVDMSHRSLAWIFTPGLSSHYRPSSYVWWLAIRALFGRFDSAAIYWINLALHCANMALVMRLSRELRQKRRNQITAQDICGGLLFGVFPLSYQVLTWSSAMVHETLVLYVLAAGLIWTHLRRNSGRLWVKLALLCLVALGCLSHQLGFLAPLLVCLVCVATTRPPLPVAARLFAVSGAASLAYGLWLRTFQTGLPLPHGTAEVIARLAQGVSVPLVMQALSFPLIPVLVALGFQQPVVETGMAVMVAGAIVSLLSCAVAIRTRKLVAWVFAMCWTAVIAGAFVLALHEDYVEQGPRLFYSASVGICLLWAALLTSGSPRVRGLSIAFTSLVCMWCAWFVLQRVQLALQASAAIKSIAADLRGMPGGAQVFIQNQPDWINITQNKFPFPATALGTSGVVVFASGYGDAGQLYEANGAGAHEIHLLTPPDLELRQLDLPNAFAHLATGESLSTDALARLIRPPVAIYEYVARNNRLLAQAHGQYVVSSAASGNVERVAQFELEPGRVILQSASASQCANGVMVRLHWSGVENLAAPIGVFVHVNPALGTPGGGRAPIAAINRDPLNGMLSLNAVQKNAHVIETRWIALPPGGTQAPVDVRVGLYYTQTGQPKRAWRADGVEWENNEVVILVERAAPRCGN